MTGSGTRSGGTTLPAGQDGDRRPWPAWVIAASVLDLQQPFLAPWSALLVVHATVYRTFSKGMQQVAATVVAVLLATVVGETLWA